MPILYDEAARAFLLQGKNSTYAIQISKKDTVCQMHWGEKLEDALKHYDLCDRKIRARGQSIVGAANRLISYGVPQNTKKPDRKSVV